VDRYPRDTPPAFRSKVDGVWKPITHREAADRVQAIALGLRSLGVKPGDRVSILSENRPEWALTDFACLALEAADVPIYPTLPAKQAEYMWKDSGCAVICCSTAEQAAKVFEVRGALPALRQVVVFDSAARRVGAMTLAEVEALGRKAGGDAARFRADALTARPETLATLIYTSGTTGEPKGVMLTHHNICSNIAAALQVMPLSDRDETLSMLPLSHIFERMVDYTMFAAGVVINYAESFDKVAQNLAEVKPTVVVSVPRLYEKVYARVLENALSGSGVKRGIFYWAKRVGEQCATYELAGLKVPAGLALQRAVADRLVFAKLRARTGGRVKYFVSGSAPLAADVAKFFFAAKLPVIEGYGLTETSPVITLNRLDKAKLGTVGPVVPGVAIKIAADGEILARGPNIMRGYYNKPEATTEAIDADGWFHTGDIGEIDAEGFLKITDRKKDLIKTAGGKYVAPQPIENLVKTNRFVANAVMLGDKRKFPIVIVVPNFETLERWARERNLSAPSRTALIALPDVKAKMEREVMSPLRDLARYEMPKKVLLLDADFSIESGELTPTLKVKRRAVEQRYGDLINRAYAEADATSAGIES